MKEENRARQGVATKKRLPYIITVYHANHSHNMYNIDPIVNRVFVLLLLFVAPFISSNNFNSVALLLFFQSIPLVYLYIVSEFDHKIAQIVRDNIW